jgi:tetratricopeptide (TPR) repeat protein
LQNTRDQSGNNDNRNGELDERRSPVKRLLNFFILPLLISSLVIVLGYMYFNQTIQSTNSDKEALEAYNKGQYFYRNKYMATERIDDFKLSEGFYKQAIELNPDYPSAYRGLAVLYGRYAFTITKSNERDYYLARRDSLFKKAYLLDSTSAEAYQYNIDPYKQKGDYEKIYESYKKALELDPNSFYGNANLAIFLIDRELCDVALIYFNKCMESDPLYDMYMFVNRAHDCYATLGDYATAEADIHTSLAADPNNHWTLERYLEYLVRTKRFVKAEEIYRRLFKTDTEGLYDYALINALIGNNEKAIYLIQQVLDEYGGSRYLYRTIARIYSIMGMKEETLTYLKNESDAFAEIGDSIYLWLINDPIYDDIRDDHRFIDVLPQSK